mgnify:CR=1 FL=1
MNSSVCFVDQYRIKYREIGTNTWNQKNMGSPLGSCTWPCNKVNKLIYWSKKDLQKDLQSFEHKNREFISQVLLSTFAIKKGLRVYLGNYRGIFKLLSFLNLSYVSTNLLIFIALSFISPLSSLSWVHTLVQKSSP